MAGFEFDDNAFADTVLEVNGEVAVRAAANIEDALTGPTLTGTAELGNVNFSGRSGSVVLGFTDNLIINRTGADVMFFEEGPGGSRNLFESLRVSLTSSGLSTDYVNVSVTNFNGTRNSSNHQINYGVLDLSDLGIADGATVDQLAITSWNASRGGADLTAVAAIHSASPVPEPSSMILFAIGIAAIGVYANHRMKSVALSLA